jgi:cell cycle checkpoint protein
MKKSVSEWVTGLDISSSSLTADTSRVTRPAKRFRKSASQKSMKHKTLVSDPSVRSGSNNDEAWSTRYPPKSINELCVHKKKISEVQKWLENAFSIVINISSLV